MVHEILSRPAIDRPPACANMRTGSSFDHRNASDRTTAPMAQIHAASVLAITVLPEHCDSPLSGHMQD